MPRLYDPDALKYSTFAEDAKWSFAFLLMLAIPSAAITLIVLGFLALL